MKKENKIFLGIIIGILIISSLLVFILANHRPTGAQAQVSLYGEVIKTFDLTSIEEPITFEVDNKKGGLNTIRVEKGRIGITHANCPDQLCVERGFISDSIIPNVCLPNGVVVEIISNTPSSNAIDTIAE